MSGEPTEREDDKEDDDGDEGEGDPDAGEEQPAEAPPHPDGGDEGDPPPRKRGKDPGPPEFTSCPRMQLFLVSRRFPQLIQLLVHGRQTLLGIVLILTPIVASMP